MDAMRSDCGFSHYLPQGSRGRARSLHCAVFLILERITFLYLLATHLTVMCDHTSATHVINTTECVPVQEHRSP